MPTDFRCTASSRSSKSPAVALVAAIIALASPAFSANTPSCPVVAAHELTPAEDAYSHSHYAEARQLYTQLLATNPHDQNASAGLVHTLLRQGSLSEAADQAAKGVADDPHSAVALTAQAEVQLRLGQPWLALDTLKAATETNPCYARARLIHSRVMRIDSMYASERADIQAAYEIDPNDPDIKHAYLSTAQAAHDIESISQSLENSKDLDAASRKMAEESIRAHLPLLSENNQTCQVLPTAASATLPLQPSRQDGKHIDGYRLQVAFPKSSGSLQVDTAASGLFISRAMADANGFQPSADGPAGTVLADSVRIGPLEFRNCTVGVTDTPFAGKADGFIGTDMFAQWLITMDEPQEKLILDALPKQAGVVPGDRANYPELKGFMPVYHRQQYLMVPVTLNNKTRQLFILDTGIRFTTMTPEVAHSISTTKANFTNPMQTVSGATLQVYRDAFDFQLANLSLTHQSHILVFDPSTVRQNSGMLVAGMLGFDMLHSMVIHLDYRDGLVKLDTTDQNLLMASAKEGAAVQANSPAASPLNERADDKRQTECPALGDQDRLTKTAIIATITGTLDSAHLKPGKEFNVKVGNGWESSQCTLEPDSLLYGHVVSASSSKDAGSELGLSFDQAECGGRAKKEVSLRLLGVVAAPDASDHFHNAMPAEVEPGKGREISSTAAAIGSFVLDMNLNPGGPPKTIHPGIVVGLPKIKLEPQGGPGCSAMLTSTDRSLRIGTGVTLLLDLLVSK